MVAFRIWGRDFLTRSSHHLSPHFNFLTLHYVYFIGVCLISSVIFWGSSTPPRQVSYTDSLFFAVSAMTLAGLNTVNLSQLNTFQQFLLFLLILLGSAILVSSAVVHVRRKSFERKFTSIIQEERRKRKAQKASMPDRGLPFTFSRRRSVSISVPEVDGVVKRGRVIHSPTPSKDLYVASMDNPGDHPPPDRECVETVNINATHGDGREGLDVLDSSSGAFETEQPVVAGSQQSPNHISFASPSSPLRTRQRLHVVTPKYAIPLAALTEETGVTPQGTHKYFKSDGFIGRNSQFHSLTLEERERLGGVEYRAIVLLELIVPLYFVLWQLIGCIGLGAYVAVNRPDTALQNGLNPWWVGAFNAVSAFNNSGMSLLDANMVAFQTSDYMLITMGLLILAGNTCYPVFLRLIIWTFLKLLPENPVYDERRVTLRFLLDHPRRCYTTLFPSTHTWWLVGSLIVLNGIDWAAFEILNNGNPLINTLPRGTRVLDGLFQAFAVRSGGFYVVSIAQLRIGLLILYVIMMYISVYPVAITIRNSNVYEERSLGIYADDPSQVSRESKRPPIRGLIRHWTNRSGKEPREYFIRQQLRGQLAHDLWWIVLAVLFIAIIETGQYERDPVNYSVFNVIFEVISAYGCVGISVGLPGVAYSFCGGWHALSKLILCAVMIRGRHRGLPVAIDRAVLLPGEDLGTAEEEDAQIRLERTMSRR